MSVVITAIQAGIVLTYAPLVNPNSRANTTRPATDLAIGSQQKIRTPLKRQLGKRIVRGP
jgi:hypothetical protein